MKEDYYIKRWIEGALTEEERKVFEDSEDYKELIKLYRSTMALRAPEFKVEAELERFKSAQSSKGRVTRMNWVRPFLRAAAVTAVMITGYVIFFKSSDINVQTAAKEKTELQLPDASTVVLNAQSVLSYSEKSWLKQRRVTLDGEAYFTVAKGSKFSVKTPAGVVMVLGTQFNVKNRVNYFEVVCYEGRVSVKQQDQVYELPANNRFQMINGVIQQDVIRNQSAPSWINQESSFQSVPFAEVILELERQYNVEISTTGIDDKLLFTGRFIHSDLTLALKSVSIPLNLTYELTDNHHIVLSGETR